MIPMPRFFAAPKLLAALCLLALAACANDKPDPSAAPSTIPGYEAMVDEGFEVPAVEARDMPYDYPAAEVAYSGGEKPGSIVVDTFARRLYHVKEGGMATRYTIAVGREGLSFRGTGAIGRKEKWPSWQPTANMVRTRPDLYAKFASGLPGGMENPLGARALYLHRGGRDTMFRIHGSIQNEAIGRATSAGCIRLYNQDVIRLFEEIDLGTSVKVRSQDESLEMEGPFIEDAWGRVVPDTVDNRATKEVEIVSKAEQHVREAEADLKVSVEAAKLAEKADKKRLRDCKRQGLDETSCPALPEPVLAAGEVAPEKAMSVEDAQAALDKAKLELETARGEGARLAACTAQGVAHEDCPPASAATVNG
jgi:lipoprotein-anchoring transpeptidase ErfK/SrfK